MVHNMAASVMPTTSHHVSTADQDGPNLSPLVKHPYTLSQKMRAWVLNPPQPVSLQILREVSLESLVAYHRPSGLGKISSASILVHAMRTGF